MRRKAIILLVSLLPTLTTGCLSLGYQSFKPNETGDYNGMLADWGDQIRNDGWVWVRGRALGDLDGDGRDEEAVIATLQTGLKNKPGPITKAVLLICSRDEQGQLKLKLRRNIFESGRSLASASLPEGVHLKRPTGEMTHVSLKILPDDVDNHWLVLVSIWNEPAGSRVTAWHAGYIMIKGELKRVFHTLARQDGAMIQNMDLNKDGIDELIITETVLPPSATERATGMDTPEWLSVFSRDKDNIYRQADMNFKQLYGNALLSWYQNYVLHLNSGSSRDELSTYEYYLGRIHMYRKEYSPAISLLKRAADGSRNALLKRLATEALAATRKSMDESVKQ